MRRKLIVALAAVAVAVPVVISTASADTSGVAVPAAPVTGQTVYDYSFENNDWQGWRPEDGGETRGWWIEHSTAQHHTGSTALNFQLDGRWDNGTIWIEHDFTGPVGTSVPVTVSYWAWAPPTSGAASPAAGVWPTRASIATTDHDTGWVNPPWPPTSEWNDKLPEATGGGWKQYSYNANLNTVASNGYINVAVAIHAQHESKLTYHHFDDVKVTIG